MVGHEIGGKASTGACASALENVRTAKGELVTAIDEVISRLLRDVQTSHNHSGPHEYVAPPDMELSETYEERKLMAMFDEFEWAVIRLRESCRVVAHAMAHPVSEHPEPIYAMTATPADELVKVRLG